MSDGRYTTFPWGAVILVLVGGAIGLALLVWGFALPDAPEEPTEMEILRDTVYAQRAELSELRLVSEARLAAQRDFFADSTAEMAVIMFDLQERVRVLEGRKPRPSAVATPPE